MAFRQNAIMTGIEKGPQGVEIQPNQRLFKRYLGVETWPGGGTESEIASIEARKINESEMAHKLAR